MGDSMKVEVKDIDKLLQMDPYLKDYEQEIRRRYDEYGGEVSRTFQNVPQ